VVCGVVTENAVTVSQLPFRCPSYITSLTGDNELNLDLMRLGLVPGTRIEVIRRAPFGGPLEIDVVGSRLVIRRSVASMIKVTNEPTTNLS